MNIVRKTLKNEEQLRQHILERVPSLYTASKTSTVLPYGHDDQLQEELERLYLVDLSSLPEKIEIKENGDMVISGPVTWEQARQFCQSKGRMLMTSPTEDSAQVLAGVATSCTGERCFGLGTLRDQLNWVRFMTFNGDLKTLTANHPFEKVADFSHSEKALLKNYQQSYQAYKNFKNAPYPRFEVETDLMTGTEGQLGVIVEASMKTLELKNLIYLFVKLPKWENDYQKHVEIFKKVQNFRSQIISCELLDENSLSYLPEEMQAYKGSDLIFLEMAEEDFEEVYEKLIQKLKGLNDEDFFSLDESKCKRLRVSVPRSIFEVNSKMGVVKQGTDIQVKEQDIEQLFELYRELAKKGMTYNLFGHFGDAHLHFNFMPRPEDIELCQNYLKELYQKIIPLKASPFAEHGVGLMKKKYINDFYTEDQRPFFSVLKKYFDPQGQFFPHGFMNSKGEK